MTAQRACEGRGVRCLLGKGWARQGPASRFPGENPGEVPHRRARPPAFRGTSPSPGVGVGRPPPARHALPVSAPTPVRPARGQCPDPRAAARASPSSARRCFRRVSTSFLGSSTFWVDFFTSPWLLRENIPPREARSRRCGRRRRGRASHSTGSGPARVAWATWPPLSVPPPLPLQL